MNTSLQISPAQSLYVTKQNLYKKIFKHLKNYLTQTWIFIWNLEHGKELSLTHLKLEAFNNSKNFLPHFFKHQRWNFQQLEKLSSTHFQFKTWNLRTWRTFFHTREVTTIWKSLFHTSHSLGNVVSSLYATTWRWTPTHFAN